MTLSITRRGLLQGFAASAVVLGYDPRLRSWVTEARAGVPVHALPALDGTVFTDPAHLSAAGDDFGHIVSRQPVAVLFPGSVNDVVKMVRYAGRHGLKVAMKGQGHAQFGQAQAQGGVVIDSSSLSSIHNIASNRARVDAGVTWSALFDAAAAEGLTPPVLTDYLDLSIGGTLSVGGIGGTVQRFGLQADNVLELEVVTGAGDLVTCSATQHPLLFNAVLAGLGQCGIILRASVRLVPAESHAQVFNLFYDDISEYVQDQRRLLTEQRFSYLEGQVVAHPSGSGWRYMIEAATFYTSPAAPDLTALLHGLRDSREDAQITTQTYRDFAFRLVPVVEFLKSIGVWGFPHPWLSLWVPASQAASYVGGVMAGLTVADTGQGPILFYPIDGLKVRRPLFRLPEERVAFAFNILRTAPPDPGVVSSMLSSNRALYEGLLSVGGTRYAIGAIPFSEQDWRQHFEPVWPFLDWAKQRYDPQNVLTPGPGIFS